MKMALMRSALGAAAFFLVVPIFVVTVVAMYGGIEQLDVGDTWLNQMLLAAGILTAMVFGCLAIVSSAVAVCAILGKRFPWFGRPE